MFSTCRSIPILFAAAVLGAGVGACGGSGDGGGGAKATDLRGATLQYARCMRENGVDMPDPKTDENGVTIADGGQESTGARTGQASSRRFLAAEEKCRRHLRDVKPPQLSEEEQQEFRRKALEHAKCMRENGVDFPDPKFSEDGGALVDASPGSGLDPDSPAFKRAEENCRDLMGGPGGGTAGGGS